MNTNLVTIESEVPYSALIYAHVQLHANSMKGFVEHSRKYERAYLAWETVRKLRNPFFLDGTGLEGYFVGQCASPLEMAQSLLQLGHYMLASNARLYPYNAPFRSRLMKTLLSDVNDLEAIEVWAAEFGAAVGALRCKLLTNERARYFQADTYQCVSSVPPIRYLVADHAFTQQYTIRAGGVTAFPYARQSLSSMVKPSDLDAYQAIKAVGRFGHPLLRQYLSECSTLSAFNASA